MNLWGDLLEATGFADLLSVGRWVTLSSGSRVKLSPDGRVVAGLPGRFHGVHVRDLPTLFRRERELGSVDCDAEACSDCPTTFPNKAAATTALLDANPELRALLESDGGAGTTAYRAWVAHARRGPKPQLADGDGRFDALNERWELRGTRRVASWLEAIYVTIPTSRKWDELPARLKVLEEATGLTLWVPAEAERAEVGRLDVAQCTERLNQELDALFASAMSGRLTPDADAAVPF